jgi:hypothetical protein
VIEIQQCAFASCDSLTSLDLPEGLHYIGPESYSFYWTCIVFKLQTIGKHSYSVHRLCKLGVRVFRRCTGLRSVILPETSEIIEDRDECISPTHIEILLTVTEIGVAAFLYCKGLKHLRIPSNVTRIERATFVQCTRLIPSELPQRLEIIDLVGRVDSHDEEPDSPNDELRNIYVLGVCHYVSPLSWDFGVTDVLASYVLPLRSRALAQVSSLC